MRNSPVSRIPQFKLSYQEKGTIRDIREMIVRIDGLPSCLNGQIVTMGESIKGIIMGFDEDFVLALALGDQTRLRMGQAVTGASEPFTVPVGRSLLGRMVSALGAPCDGGEEVEAEDRLPVLRDSVPLIGRAPVNDFLETGTKIVDMLTPLGKGQRQLIMGDRITGKTVIAVDAMLHQKGKNVVCIYCCIGKSVSSLQKVATALHDGAALDYTVMVAATDNAPVGEQYLVPFSAAAIGEYFVSKGRDVLVILDDLTKHAWAYRQMSLLMERPPGREAYPGDVFYVQTQLMERAGKFSDEHGGGSMTFLGLAETQQGDLTGFIPSNLASMCDGQIYLSSQIFAEGVRPAIDVNLSISIVGGRVQPSILKELSLGMSGDYARYAEVLRLSRVSSGLSPESERLLRRGEVMRCIFMQSQFRPVSLAEQVLVLFAVKEDLLDPLAESLRRQFRDGIFAFAHERAPQLIEAIELRRELIPEIAKGLRAVSMAFVAELEAQK